jgi:hypothetical protein
MSGPTLAYRAVGAIIGAIAIAYARSSLSLHQSYAAEHTMSPEISASPSRIGQPRLKPVVFEGKRYEQIMNGEREGLSQRTGLLAIYDDSTNKRIAVVKIYDVARDPRVESDVQDVFFVRMELDAPKRELRIENERHKHFALDIDQRIVRALD